MRVGMARTPALLLAGLLSAVVLPPEEVRAGEFFPWSSDPAHAVTAEATPGRRRQVREQVSAPAPFGLALLFWSSLLTRVDGPRCAHRPACSVYAGQALHRHGILPGLLMVLDRLLRGARSSSLRWLPVRQGRLFDPLEEAEFWKDGYCPMSGRHSRAPPGSPLY